MKTLKIDPEFKNIIPPLSDDERCQLEENILASGYVDPIVTWKGIIIDGHHRYDICQHHEIDFETRPMQFASRNGAIEWMIRHQFGRRNLPDYVRAKLALRLKPIIQEKAKENQEGGVCLKSDKGPIHTDAEVAKEAGVSKNTIQKVAKIEAEASDEDKAALAAGEVSINQVHKKIIASKPPPPPKNRVFPKDDKGKEIPNALIPLWNRRREVKDIINTLNEIKRNLKKAWENRDPLYAGGKMGRSPLNYQSVDAQLSMAVADLYAAYHVRVCPSCHGETCRACCGLGLISEFYLKTIPESIRGE